MQTAVLFALLQATAPIQLTEVYRQPVNDRYTISVAGGERALPGGIGTETEARVLVRGRGWKEPRMLVLITEKGDATYSVLRVDDSTLVIGRMGFYMSGQSTKLFYDLSTATLLKRIDYPPDAGLASVDSVEAARTLGIPIDVLQQLRAKPSFLAVVGEDSSYLPKELREHPLPQPTYAEFARARPDAAAREFDESSTTLEARVGPFQRVGDRIWVGEVFYDGEGVTGIGRVGYLDTRTSTYTWLRIPMLLGWSASALLIDGDVAWIGRSAHPEGEEYPGGLLRYDLKTGATKKFPVEEVIGQIVRWKDGIYLGTKNGGYTLQGDRLLARYWVEPSRDGRFIMVTERPPKPSPAQRKGGN